jgi:hypothetical protein
MIGVQVGLHEMCRGSNQPYHNMAMYTSPLINTYWGFTYLQGGFLEICMYLYISTAFFVFGFRCWGKHRETCVSYRNDAHWCAAANAEAFLLGRSQRGLQRFRKEQTWVAFCQGFQLRQSRTMLRVHVPTGSETSLGGWPYRPGACREVWDSNLAGLRKWLSPEALESASCL